MSNFNRFEMQDKYPNPDDQCRLFSWDAFYDDQSRQYGNPNTSGSMLTIDATRRNSLIQVANSLSVLGLSQPEDESIVYKLASLSRGEIPAPEAGWWNRVTTVITGRGTSTPEMILTEEQLDTIYRKAGLATQIRTVKGVLEAYREIVMATRDSSSMV
ncbi:hypothetical protein L486_01805 [Kwoniella mangroviensis CBS 10435]|uniref:Uncharacterized protein n=1 Tax=Kwoniella mangroviensis CBS 10435 TaxID=1331196 RepID=A0A1B9J2X8_9TREE|nr:hypothetical protein L486_01805 [Kwoniella mangroviensis CBS 10435]OCF73291.1 hypothetical protein I204_06522 [Kwoniella mangroviensis CBS 8886]